MNVYSYNPRFEKMMRHIQWLFVVGTFIIESVVITLLIHFFYSEKTANFKQEFVIRYLLITTALNVSVVLIANILLRKVDKNNRFHKYLLIMPIIVICTNIVVTHYEFENTFLVFLIPIILTTLYQQVNFTLIVTLCSAAGITVGLLAKGRDADYSFDVMPVAVISYIVMILGYFVCRIVIMTLKEQEKIITRTATELANSEKEKELSNALYKELSKTNMQFIKALSKTVEAKDRYTNGHSERVAMYSYEIANRMGKSEKEAHEIYIAALLHDVGKIRIPNVIINKDSKLTDEENSYMKLHPNAGYHILKEVDCIPNLAEGARYHHERYDGKGYPNGLEGEDIPEIARIIAVADAYDAMASNRSYRSALPQDIVRAEIEKNKGTQFDPKIADIMLQIIDDDKEYKLKEAEKTTKNILLIDDEAMLRKQVRHLLKEREDIILYEAASGEAGIGAILTTHMDLILVDIMLMDMDGFQILEEIHMITNDVPVIFLTGCNDIESIHKALDGGVMEYLTKPITKQTLFETIDNALMQ